MSDGKTEHLDLNQWVLEDPVRMDDFNEDNLKIDAGISAVQIAAANAQIAANAAQTAANAAHGAAQNAHAAANTAQATANNATLPIVTQAEAEAGTGNVMRAWTPQRVRQAVAAAPGSWEKLIDTVINTAAANVELNLSSINLNNYMMLRVYYSAAGTTDDTNADRLYFRLNKIAEGYVWRNITNTQAFNSASSAENRMYFMGGFADITLFSRVVYVRGIMHAYHAPLTLRPNEIQTLDLMGNTSASANFPVGSRFIVMGVRK